MNNDLISRSALYKEVESLNVYGTIDNENDALLRGSEVFNLIDSALTVEQPQGEWIRISAKSFKCKDCNYATDVKYPYCPICGNKMINDEFSDEFKRTYLYDKNLLPIV